MQFIYPEDPVSILHEGMGIITTGDEWDLLLQSVRKGGEFSLLTDLPGLIARSKNDSLTVRENALQCLVSLNQPDGWKAVAACLQQPDLRDAATDAIIYKQRFEHWPQALRAAKEPSKRRGSEMGTSIGSILEYAMDDLEDDQIRTLLAMRDPDVNFVCLHEIEKNRRFELHHEVLALLNEERTPRAMNTLQAIIAGPGKSRIEDGKGNVDPDALSWLLRRCNAKPENKQVLRKELEADSIQREVARLHEERSPGNWEKIKEVTVQWEREHPSHESQYLCFAAFVQAMHACDASQTREWLMEKLRSAMRSAPHRMSPEATRVLSAMGAIEDPAFLPLLEEFGGTMKIEFKYHPRSERLPYDRALHRCRKMYHWELEEMPDGTFRIHKPSIG